MDNVKKFSLYFLFCFLFLIIYGHTYSYATDSYMDSQIQLRYICQSDYKNITYYGALRTNPKATIFSNGCGITSAAMIITYLRSYPVGTIYSPENLINVTYGDLTEVSKYATDVKITSINMTTNNGNTQKAGYNQTFYATYAQKTQIIEALSTGCPIINGTYGRTFASGDNGHYVVLSGLGATSFDNNTDYMNEIDPVIYVVNPNEKKYQTSTLDLIDQITNQAYYIFQKSSALPLDSYSLIYDYEYYADRNTDVLNAAKEKALANNKGGNESYIQYLVALHFFTYGIKEGRQASPYFNVKDYVKENSDIADFCKTGTDENGNTTYDYSKALLHYCQNGYNEGRICISDHSTIFDPTYYGNRYPNLVEVYGYNNFGTYNASLLVNHFIKWGLSEGRQASSTFSVVDYINENSAISNAYGTNYAAALHHYLRWGWNNSNLIKVKQVENISTEETQADTQESENESTEKSNTNTQESENVTTEESQSDTQESENVTTEESQNNTQESENVTTEESQNNTQESENTTTETSQNNVSSNTSTTKTQSSVSVVDKTLSISVYDIVFDYEYYIYHYPDVFNYFKTIYHDDSQLQAQIKNHFFTQGIKEGRQASPYFNVIDYIKENAGVAEYCKTGTSNGNTTYDYLKALNHYLAYGYAEGRVGISDHATIFDPIYYGNMNPNLVNAYGYNNIHTYNASLLVNHFIKWGISEGRDSSPYFNVKDYISSNNVIGTYYSGNYAGAIHHYNLWGWSNSDLITISDHATIFDPIYYADNNPDLLAAFGHDVIKLTNHFKNYGIYEQHRKTSPNFNVLAYIANNTDISSDWYTGIDSSGNAEYDIYQAYRSYCTIGNIENRIAINVSK